MNWLKILIPAPFAVLPSVLPAATVQSTADSDAAFEFAAVSPKGFDKNVVTRKFGEVDNRVPDPDKDGLMLVGPGDRIELVLKVPSELHGKSAFCVINYQIREEYEKNCKTIIKHHNQLEPVDAKTPLVVGRQVHVEVLLESLADPKVVERHLLKPGVNPPIDVKSGARLRIKYVLPRDTVTFETRDALTDQEHRDWVDPRVADLKRNPNVEFNKSPVVSDVSVHPGNVDLLSTEVKVHRARR